MYRGVEFTKEELKKYKQDLADNQYMIYVTNSTGETYKRIRYGEEIEAFKEFGELWIERTYCPDCEVKKGEYHLNECDCEIWPKCGDQLISCNCNWIKYTAESEEEKRI